MTPETPKRMGREQRRAALLDAAAAVLRTPDTTLTFESIADAAGVSATLPYKYFESIDEVALALYTRFVHQIDTDTEALLRDPDAGFDAKVRGGMDFWFDAVRRDGLLLERLTGANAPSGLQRFIAERRARVGELWAREIESTFALAPTEAALAATALVAASSAVMVRCRVERLDREEVTSTFVRMARAMCAGTSVGA